VPVSGITPAPHQQEKEKDMRRFLHATLLSAAVATAAAAFATGPASAQMDQMYEMDQANAAISLDAFSDQLAPYGYWLYSDRWGLVWQPDQVPYDFRPYFTAGHWVDTDEYGWYWQSRYPWGDIPFHYGRWVNDPDNGWLWIPGYVWSPGWVTWRSNGQYIGWMPTPPDDAFLAGQGDIGFGLSFRFGLGQIGGFYGYSRWYGPGYNENLFAQNWVFVGLGQVMAPDYATVAISNPVQVINIIHQTRNVTNYTVVNNYVVNRSVNVQAVERAAGHPIPVVRAATIVRNPNLVATVAVGQRVQMRMRAVAPHGTGVANSAPPPPPRIVAKLSTRVPPARPGHAPAHLFTRATVTAPEAQGQFHGTAPHAPGANGMARPGGPPPAGMAGPNGERPPTERPPGMAGPGGPPPAGMAGPNGERPPTERPPGMAGPNGERPPAERLPGMTGPSAARPPAEHPPAAAPNAPQHEPPKKPPPKNPPQ
jgi:hypothetical protein